MNLFLRFGNSKLLLILIPCIIAAFFLQVYFKKISHFRYSLARLLQMHGRSSNHPFKKILYCIRLCALIILLLVVGQPQLVDSRSKVTVDGIDIMLVLDASGSMFNFYDCGDDTKCRFAIAQEEAIRFIHKRTNDALGLVIFGKQALSRCPLTVDKKIIERIVREYTVEEVDPNGTVLSTAILTAANRLKHATGKSKIMILLTDGEPSPEDVDPNLAIEVAKKMGIKIYTIGIGSEISELIYVPGIGMHQKPRVNCELLKKIAQETGGKSFMAHNAVDMRTIYETIDALEKTNLDVPLFSKFYDISTPFIFLAFSLILLEIVATSLFWFGI